MLSRFVNNICMSLCCVVGLIAISNGSAMAGVHPTSAVVDPAREDLFTWGKVRQGWQVGVRLLGSRRSLDVGDPVVFQFALRNPTDEQQTVVIKQFDGIYPTLGADNRINLNITGSSQQKHQHTVEPGEVLEARQYRVVLSTEGLPPGDYHVSRTTPFWVPHKEQANRSSGLSIRVPIGFTIGDPSKTKLSKLPSADNKEDQIYWGKPVAGLVVGMRISGGDFNQSLGSAIAGEMFVRNLSTREIEFEYEMPGHSDWNTNMETHDGKHVNLNMVFYSGFRPRVTTRLKLRPFEQKQIFGVKGKQMPEGPMVHIVQDKKDLKGHAARSLVTSGGEYRWFAHLTIRQFAVTDLDMVIGSSGVPFLVKSE